MTELFTVALQLQKICRERAWSFCVIGGLAVQHWGEPRFTKDVDMTLLTGFGGEKEYVETLLKIFRPRIEGAGEFALQNRVLLLQSSEGIGIDRNEGVCRPHFGLARCGRHHYPAGHQAAGLEVYFHPARAPLRSQGSTGDSSEASTLAKDITYIHFSSLGTFAGYPFQLFPHVRRSKT